MLSLVEHEKKFYNLILITQMKFYVNLPMTNFGTEKF